ncbi:MAG: polyhydroxyalkanoate granule-associated phasin [Betaproteobacteria bacterium]
MQQRNRKAGGNPFQSWTDLAWKWGEMSVASAQVIAHRTARMAAAGPNPDVRDRREFARMGQEKIDAAAASSRVMAAQLFAMNLRFGARLFGQAITTGSAMVSLARSRDAGQFLKRQSTLVASVARSASTAAEISQSTVRLAASGLTPIHARVTANARRLAKR